MRLDSDTLREIADSLSRNRSRTFLTGFGIFWGLFMLLALIGGGRGFKEMLMQNFTGFASNAAMMVSSNTSVPCKGLPEGRYWSMNLGDLDRIKAMVPGVDVVTPLQTIFNVKSEYGDRSYTGSLKGIRPDYASIEAPDMKYGRFINRVDIEQERKVCVLGKRVYEELFPDGGDPCGAFLKVGGVYYRVVGMNVSETNMSINGRGSQSVLVPASVMQRIYNLGDAAEIVCLTAKPGVKVSELEKRIRFVLGRRHSFDPEDDQALWYLNTEEMFSMMDSLFKGVNFLIWLIGLGTLLAGAIGVSNIMMVTVRERTVEIGIRRAIGATPKDILSQIMMESVILTLLAGALGIMFSVLVLNVLEVATGNPVFQIDFWTAALSTALLAVLGILAGLAPASRAMNIRAVDAMRDE